MPSFFPTSLRPRNLNQVLWRLLGAVVVPLLLGTLAILALQSAQDKRVAQGRMIALAETWVQAVDAEPVAPETLMALLQERLRGA